MRKALTLTLLILLIPCVYAFTDIAVQALKFSSNTLVAGQRPQGIILLTSRAEGRGSTVSLSLEGSGKQFVSVPDSVLVPTGKTAAAFPITIARGLTMPQTVRIQARIGQTKPQEAELTLTPISIGSLTFVPESPTAGHEATVLVTLNGLPEKPIKVQLTCAEPEVKIEPKVASLGSQDSTPLFRLFVPQGMKKRTITLTALANGQTFQKTITLVPSTKEGK